jgi:hypothetical protein
MVQERRSAANRHFANAHRLVGHDDRGAELEARRAIDQIVRAFWWAEGTDQEEDQHRTMHKFGRWTREIFGCALDFDGEKYEQRCPILIAHKRIGLSPGFTARRICSICAEDLSECPHRRTRLYWVRGGAKPPRPCPVCMKEQCSTHDPGRLYKAQPVSIVTDIQGLEVSIVRSPAQPEARLLALPVDKAALIRGLGPEFKYGMPVSCDRCLEPCRGFDEVDLSHDQGAVGSVLDVREDTDGEVIFDLGME